MTYLTQCRRAALQRLRTVRPTVAERRLQNLKRLMQIGRGSGRYPRTSRVSFWGARGQGFASAFGTPVLGGCSDSFVADSRRIPSGSRGGDRGGARLGARL